MGEALEALDALVECTVVGVGMGQGVAVEEVEGVGVEEA